MSRLPLALAALLLAASLAPAALAEETGTWRFSDDTRPIKAVVVGGSVTAWPRGNFGHFLEAACPRVEIALKGKERLGAKEIKARMIAQVIKNRRLKVADHEAVWLIYQSGLNSIAMPEDTNLQGAETFALAHKHGLKVLALSLGPWGATTDGRRWGWANGLAYTAFTRKAVDFILGRLSPAEALGALAKGREQADWLPEERPDLAIDLYDSALRDKDAELLDEAATLRHTKSNPAVKRELKALADPGARDARLAELVALVRQQPQWFMKKTFHSFDHIHPNMEGHRVMAQTICPKLPASWGCDCAAIAGMDWLPKGGGVGPKVEAPAAP